MEDLKKKHGQEQKDVQSRITQKKKSATKKTRKGVNDECAELERRLRERQADEIACLDGNVKVHGQSHNDIVPQQQDEETTVTNTQSVQRPIQGLSLSSSNAVNGYAKKPNRQKARLARRAAEQEAAVEQAEKEASDLPNLREKEIQSMQEVFSARGLKEHEIRSDGHCLYSAIADQLISCDLGLKPSIQIDDADLNPNKAAYSITRQVAASYISQNANDFIPFLEQPLDQYLRIIRETGEWGGHLEILALAKAYRLNIHVLHANGHVDRIESGASSDHEPLWLAYYHHSYGLGEHYNSLRKAR